MKSNFNILFSLLAFLLTLGMLIAVVAQHSKPYATEPDTIVVRDTIVKTKPKEVVKYIVKYDTLKIAINAIPDALKAAADTLTIGTENKPLSAQETANLDSIEICLPIEQKEYRDSTYQAWISGYHAKLDSIKIFNQNNIIIKQPASKNKLRLHFTPSVGFGYGIYHHQLDCFAGVSISL